MFKVRDKATGKIYTCYAVAGNMFMLWDVNHWQYVPMEYFEPVED